MRGCSWWSSSPAFVLSPMAFASPRIRAGSGLLDDADFDMSSCTHLVFAALSSGQPSFDANGSCNCHCLVLIATKTLSLAPLRSRTTPARLPS